MPRWTPLFALLLLCNPLPAADWTEFRGPNGQGHATDKGLPRQWSDSKNVRWRQEIPGSGWSSPVVAAGRIYLTAAVDQGNKSQDLTLLCLNAADGRTVWSKAVFAGASRGRIHNKNSHASPTPIVVDDHVYVHFGPQGTACFTTAGKPVWQQVMKYRPVHGNGGSPIVVGNRLVFSVDGAQKTYVIALDRFTGKPLWQTDRNSQAQRKFSFSTPQAVEVNGKTQIISPGSDMVCGYDASSGKEIWRVEYDGYSVIPRPVIGNGHVYICTGYNQPSLLAIRLGGTGNVTDSHVSWTVKRAVPHTPSLLLLGEQLYMVSDRGVATCLNALTGDRIWQERLGGNFSASPVFADDHIYFQSEKGKTTVIRPGQKLEVVATSDLGERTLASYAIANGTIYLRTDKHLYSIAK